MNQQQLQAVLSYDKDTGVFHWKTAKKGRRPGVPAGGTNNCGYRVLCIDGAIYLGHRLAWMYVHGSMPSGVIDHINGDRLDNRISNLRDVTQVENMQNVYTAKSNNKCGYRGVSWHKQNRKYTARIKVGNRYLSLGLHKTPEEASAAYMAAKAIYHKVETGQLVEVRRQREAA